MAVFVDHLFRTPSFRTPTLASVDSDAPLAAVLVCHLSADSAAELHRFASDIGAADAPFVRGRCLPGQDHHPVFTHYLLSPPLRDAAIAAGAVVESPQDAVHRLHAHARSSATSSRRRRLTFRPAPAR